MQRRFSQSGASIPNSTGALVSWNSVERYLAEARQVGDRRVLLHGRGRRDLRLRGDVTTGNTFLFPQVAHQRTYMF